MNNSSNLQAEISEFHTQIAESLYINDLIIDLEKNGIEKEKEDFIKNYARLKEQIEQVDMVLTDTKLHNTLTEKFNQMDIKELFDILETNSGYINNFDNLNLAKLKTLLVITNILEEKINCETINIIESK